MRNPPASVQLKILWHLIERILKLKIIKFGIFIFFALLIIPLILFYIWRPQVQGDISYGTTFSNKYASDLGLNWQETYLAILDDLQIENIRLVAYWDEIEPLNDQYDFSIIKWQLDEAEKRNLNVILALGRKSPRWPECFEPQWWEDLEDENLRDQELLEYVERTVYELKGYTSIEIWQVENEPFFPFGHCLVIPSGDVAAEVELVRSLDSRPILVQDSGEGGFWWKTYAMGDYLGISMYRKIWYDFWGVFLGEFIYFKYPLAHWTYKVKSHMFGVPYERIIVTELQAEPWGPDINSELSLDEKNKSMSREGFLDTISYAQKAGFGDLYLWGVEWWYWEKTQNGNPFFWDVGRSLFLREKR